MTGTIAGMDKVRFALVLAVCALAPLNAGAQAVLAEGDPSARAAARELAQAGIDAYLAQRYSEAEQKLEKGYRLFATPTLGLWSARARMQLGRWVDAAERYRETLTLPASVGNRAAQVQALQDAKKELEGLLPRIPTLTLQLEGHEPEAPTLTLDGVVLPSAFIGVGRPTDPGKHELVAQRGAQRMVTRLQLSEREHTLLPLRFDVSSPPPSAATTRAAAPTVALRPTVHSMNQGEAPKPPLVPIGVVALVLGGAGLVTAAVTYVMGTGACPDANCDSKSSQDKYDRLQAASTWSFWPGAALAVGGAASLWIGLRAQSESEHVRWDMGPGSVSVRGTF